MIGYVFLSATVLINLVLADDLRVYETCMSVCQERFPGDSFDEETELEVCFDNCNEEEKSRCLSRHPHDHDGQFKCYQAHYDRCESRCEEDGDGCRLLCEVFSRPEEDLGVYTTCLAICDERFPDDSDPTGKQECRDNCNKEQTSRCKSFFQDYRGGPAECQSTGQERCIGDCHGNPACVATCESLYPEIAK